MKTWFEKAADGRTVAYASLAGFQAWVIEGTEERAKKALRLTLQSKGRLDLVPQLGLTS